MRKVSFPQKQPNRLAFIEGMRGLAALYVVLSHLCSMSDPSYLAGKASTAPVWFQKTISPFAFGHLAVAAFIVISGFCLQWSLFSNGDGRIKTLGGFFKRRARRILPAYYGCLAFSILVALTVTQSLHGKPFDLYLPVTRENVIAHLLMVHNWSQGWMYKLNGVLWSIAIEAQLYLLFPLIVASFFKFGRWWTLAAGTLAAGAFLVIVPDALKLYPWYLPLFALGMVGAHLAYRPHPLFGQASGAAFGVTLAGFSLAGWGVDHGWSLPSTDAVMGIAIAGLCYWGSIARSSHTIRLLSLRPLVALGGFSYSLYLMHSPIQQVLFSIRPGFARDPVATFVYLVLALPVILALCWCFSRVFEAPFLSSGGSTRAKGVSGFVPVTLPLQTLKSPARVLEPSRNKRPPGNTAARIATASGSGGAS